MARRRPPLLLNETHVALVQPATIEDGMPDPPEGLERSDRADHLATWARLSAQEPSLEAVWIFAYGSLIWKPACAVLETRKGMVRGWHRSFCLGWNTRWRGSDENPGLMLALDRGGAASGVLQRLPDNDADRLEAIVALLDREMAYKPSAFPPRWVNVATETGTVRALTFCMDRSSGRYVTGLTPHEVAEVLATARGTRGSMAEYLYETVTRLKALGLHDSHLWELQHLVAQAIEARHGHEAGA